MAALIAEGKIRLSAYGLIMSWAIAGKSKFQGLACGDGHLILRRAKSLVFAVVDGAGSGPMAATASDLCLTALQNAPDQYLEADFSACHSRLRKKRGAALGIAHVCIANGTLTWASVGDIDGVLYRGPQGARARTARILRRPGTLGISYDGIFPQTLQLGPTDLVVLSTDGVSQGFWSGSTPPGPVAAIADQIVARHAKPNDDSLALVFEVGDI